MPRFEFSLSSAVERNRMAGAVTSSTFSDALDAIADQAEVEDGDTLEIGVKGFPPARFEYVTDGDDTLWRPTGQLAA